jgi:uncharacterized protein YndB with AHSA1/START domain
MLSQTMQEQSVIHNTFVIERNYPVTPEGAFRAFADPAKKQRWFAASQGHEVEKFEMDFQPGGKELALYRFKEGTPFPGAMLQNDGWYQDIVPNQRIVIAQTMSLGGRHISSALVTFEFLESEKGTEVVLTHQGAFFEGSDGPKMREQGWRTLLDRLEKELAA